MSRIVWITAFLGVITGTRSAIFDDPRDLKWISGVDEVPVIKQAKEERTLCDTKECKQLAKMLTESMNTSVDPCDNFYEYACGNWKVHNPLPENEVSWNVLKMLQRIVEKRLLEIMEEDSSPDDLLSMRLSKRAYKACLNTDELEEKGLQPLLLTLWRIGGWPLIMEDDEWNEDLYKWQLVDDYYAHLTGLNSFHDFSTSAVDWLEEEIFFRLDSPDFSIKTYELVGHDEIETNSSDEDSSEKDSQERGSNEKRDSEELEVEDEDYEYKMKRWRRRVARKILKRNGHGGKWYAKIKAATMHDDEEKSRRSKRAAINAKVQKKHRGVGKVIARKVTRSSERKLRSSVDESIRKSNLRSDEEKHDTNGDMYFDDSLQYESYIDEKNDDEENDGNSIGIDDLDEYEKFLFKMFKESGWPFKFGSIVWNGTSYIEWSEYDSDYYYDIKYDEDRSGSGDDDDDEYDENGSGSGDDDDDEYDKDGSGSGDDDDDEYDKDESGSGDDDDDEYDKNGSGNGDDDDDEYDKDESGSGDDDDDEYDKDGSGNGDDDDDEYDKDGSGNGDGDDDEYDKDGSGSGDDDEESPDNEDRYNQKEKERKREQIRKNYAEYILNVARALAKARGIPIPKERLQKDIDDLVKFQISFIKIIYADDRERMTQLQTFQKLYDDLKSKTSNSKIDWVKKVQDLAATAGIEIDNNVNISIPSSHYVESLQKLLDNTPSRTIVNYIHWNILSRVIKATTKEMKDLYASWEDIEENASTRLEECIEDLNLKHCLGYEYVKRYFSDETLEVASDMINDIQKEVEYQIKGATWLDGSTRDYILDKLVHMGKEVGYPSWYRNSTVVKNYFRGLSISQSHFENVLSAMRYNKQQNIRRMFTGEMDERLYIDPLVVNAFFVSIDNSIEIPAPFFQSPFYEPNHPWYTNFGLIGYIMAHEIYHGYDSSIDLYDTHGSYTKWWSMMTEYNKRADCFIEQFTRYSVVENRTANIPIKDYGERTQKENIADTMGLQVAFKAYQRRQRERAKPDPVLPGFENFTNEQLFFLFLANSWCESISPEEIKEETQYSHSLGPLRIIGSVSNSEDFAKAYNCPKDSPMNPKKKCSLWK